LEIAERCETGRVGTLRQHTEPIALSISNICVKRIPTGSSVLNSSPFRTRHPQTAHLGGAPVVSTQPSD
jgi:hypothetical protein